MNAVALNRVDSPLWPAELGVPMVFESTERWPPVVRGWARGSTELRLGPRPLPVADGNRHSLSAGGLHLVLESNSFDQSSAGNDRGGWTWEGLHRIDLVGGNVCRVPFVPSRELPPSRLKYSLSPDASRVVVAEGVYVDPPRGWQSDPHAPPRLDSVPSREEVELKRAYSRIKLVAVPLDGRDAKPVAMLDASLLGGSPDSSALQWSPDGTKVAVGIWDKSIPQDGGSVLIFDTSTWEIVTCLSKGMLLGSASWGPESDRILVQGAFDKVWIHHLDGTQQDVTVLPPTRGDMRPVRALGLADNSHLLTFRTRGTKGTLMRTSLATGEHQARLTWNGEKYMYPVLSQMPPEVWA